ncbi:hypothetical protein CMK22_07435 [Candidatus Poribacteria bacterium]|nr:hypothetical protein [Candidatus Poribacteria bacterium]
MLELAPHVEGLERRLDQNYFIRDKSRIPSPSLIVFLNLVKENINRAIAVVNGDTSKLRPHTKTHKTAEIIKLQLDAGITKHKCATLREARMLAEVGISDIVIAYQIIGPNIENLVKLIQDFPEVDFKVIADHPSAVDQLSLATTQNSLQLKVMIDLNVGMHRTGIEIGDAAVELYTKIDQSKSLHAWGLHAYDGHIHDPTPIDREKSCQVTLELVSNFKEMLAEKGLEAPIVVLGGTPTFPIYAKIPDVETSPGTFIFSDYGYSRKYPDLGFIPAALLLSRVISIPTSETFTLDLGHKAIAADPKDIRGKIMNFEQVEVSIHNEEHWTIKINDVQKHISIGQDILVMPTHICPTVALHEFYYVIDTDGNLVDTWQVEARNRN